MELNFKVANVQAVYARLSFCSSVFIVEAARATQFIALFTHVFCFGSFSPL